MSTNCGVAGLFTRGRTLPARWSRRPQQAAPPGPWSCAPGAQLQAVTWRGHAIGAEPRGGGSSVQHQPKNLHGWRAWVRGARGQQHGGAAARPPGSSVAAHGGAAACRALCSVGHKPHQLLQAHREVIQQLLQDRHRPDFRCKK